MGFVSTYVADKKRGKEYVVPHPGIRASNIKPNLLVDKAEYALGINRDAKTVSRHLAFIKLVSECAEVTGEHPVQAVVKFINSIRIDKLPIPEELKHETMVAFRVNGLLPSDLPSVMDFWVSKNSSSNRRRKTYQCILCGSPCIPVTPHPLNIKNIPGGQAAGLAIISANSNAFESYGLEKSLIAPTCQSCAEAYAKGANALLASKANSLRLGPLVYIFWTKGKIELPLLALFTQSKPDPEQVEILIHATRTDTQRHALGETAFYAAALSASNARVVVRDWVETSVAQVDSNICRWFNLQRLGDEWGREVDPCGVFDLAASLCRSGDANHQMIPNVPMTIVNAAFKGGPLPLWLLCEAVKRNRVEHRVTRTRLALIKMVLLSRLSGVKEDYLVHLDTENQNPAYLCGRLLAELESIQYTATKPNTTLAGRYYATISSAPASLLGHLMRGAQSHLTKLKKENPVLQVVFQQRLEEIQSKLTSYPKLLNMEQQGYFALGYYHQKAQNRKPQKFVEEVGN